MRFCRPEVRPRGGGFLRFLWSGHAHGHLHPEATGRGGPGLLRHLGHHVPAPPRGGGPGPAPLVHRGQGGGRRHPAQEPGPGPAALRPVRDLPQGPAPARLRQVAVHPRARPQPGAGAIPGDPPTDGRRDGDRARHRHPAGRRRRGPPLLLSGQPLHGSGGFRPGHAHLLARPDADHPVLRQVSPAPRLGSGDVLRTSSCPRSRWAPRWRPSPCG